MTLAFFIDYDGKGLRQWFNLRLIFSNGSSNEQRTAQFHRDQPNMVLLAPYPQNQIGKIVGHVQAHVKVNITHRGERVLEAVKDAVLPANVKIVYKPFTQTQYTVWIHNLNEANVTVPVAALQETATQTVSLTELSLSGNQLKSTMLQNKMTWNGAQKLSLNTVYKPTDGKNSYNLDFLITQFNYFRHRRSQSFGS